MGPFSFFPFWFISNGHIFYFSKKEDLSQFHSFCPGYSQNEAFSTHFCSSLTYDIIKNDERRALAGGLSLNPINYLSG